MIRQGIRRGLSIRLRLTLGHTLVLAAVLLVFSASVYGIVRRSLSGQTDRELGREFETLAGEAAEEAGDLGELEPEGSDRLFQTVREGHIIFQSGPYRRAGLAAADAAAGSGRAGGARSVRSATGTRYRMMSGPLRSGEILTVAIDEEILRKSLRTLLLILALAFPGAVLLSASGGYWLAGRLLRPVGGMARQAERITADSLGDRLPVANPDDELGRLAAVFNRTLGRLQDAFERLRNFTADASHELRTPLAALQSVGEVALQEGLDTDAYRDRIGSMLEETSRLTRLVDNLLLLTRADGGNAALDRREQDLGEVVERAVEDLRVLAEEKGQILATDLPRGLRVRLDEDSLRRAVLNVVDNAIRYTPLGGSIAVRLEERAQQIAVAVSDTGPGIAPEHRGRIFERFYRADPDRNRAAGGAGLGLAIARWAVEANGGRIELESREGAGSVFRIVLPKASIHREKSFP